MLPYLVCGSPAHNRPFYALYVSVCRAGFVPHDKNVVKMRYLTVHIGLVEMNRSHEVI